MYDNLTLLVMSSGAGLAIDNAVLSLGTRCRRDDFRGITGTGASTAGVGESPEGNVDWSDVLSN